MSEQQIRREPVGQDNHGGEDPLAELARIVAGEDFETPVAPVEPVQEMPSVLDVQDVQAAQMLTETPAPVAPQTTAAPQEPLSAIVTPVPALDLESQLLAELGGFQPPVPPAPAFTPAPAWEVTPEPAGIEISAEQTSAIDVSIVASEPVNSIAADEDIINVEADMEALFDEQLMGDNEPVNEVSNVPDPAPIVAQQPSFEQSFAVPPGPPAPSVPSSDELDFEAAFASDNSAIKQAGSAVTDDISSEELMTISPAGGVPIAGKTDQTSKYQFQAAPDFQLQEQKIDTSVEQLQNEAIEELDIDEAFSGAFADELQVEMAAKTVAGVLLPDDNSNSETPITTPMHAHDFPEELDFESAFTEENIASVLPHAQEEPLPDVSGVENFEDINQEFLGPQHLPEIEPGAILQPRRRYGGVAIGALALGLVVVLGGGVYGYQYLNSNNAPETVLLVRADPADFKVKPEEPGGKKIANQDQPVYDAVAGDQPVGDAQEALIAVNEEPVEIVRNVVPERSAKSNDRLTNEDVGDEKNQTIALMQPRKVKTVAVRADGSIVAVENSGVVEAGNETAPANNVTSVTSDAAVGNTSIEGATTTGTIAIPSANPNAKTSELALVTPARVPENKSVVNSNTRSINVPKTVSPVSKPVAVVVPKPVVRKPVTITPVAAKTVAAVAPTGPYVVQISSQRSLESAQATYENLKRRFTGILDNQPKEIREATLEGKGTFYRVRILKGTKTAALDFCTRYKKAGGSCFVTK